MGRNNYVIAFLSTGIDEPYQISIRESVLQHCHDRGYTVISMPMVKPFSEGLDGVNQSLPVYLANQGCFDGIIILTSNFTGYMSMEEIKVMLGRFENLPLVSLGIEIAGYPSVSVDNASGMTELVEHLADFHGYRKPIYIGGSSEHLEASEREAAFRRVYRERGIEIDTSRIFRTTFFSGHGAQSIHRVLADETDFDCVICANDSMAMEVQAVLHKANPSSTRKWRVTGFDNSIAGARYPYYLSTVAQPFTEMGKAAVDLIEQKLAGKTPKSIQLKTHMELRKSCGCYYVENSKAAEQEDIILYQEQADIHRTLYKCSMSIHQAKTWDQLTTELNRCFSAFALNKAAVFLTPEYQRDLTSCSCEPLYVYDPKNPDPVVPQDLSIEEYLQRDSQVSWFVIPLQIGDTQLGYLCFEEISRFQHEYHLITSLVSSAVRILELHMIQVDYTRHLEERITSQIDKLRIEVTKRVHTEEQLRKTLYDRMRMEKEILTISEKEKRRIGQELHDDVCQRLVSISYIAGTLNQVSGDNAVKQVFDRIRCANEDVITQIKAICRGLFPIVLIEKGLSEALSDFAEYLDSCSGPCVHMIDKNTGEIPCVGNDVKLHLFRVAQEAAYNAFKHSSGTRITVSLEGTTNGVILQVQDNGTGFDPDDSSAGMGISTMRYRAALINAGLEISSGRHGTTVLCTLSRAIQSERPKWIE